MNTLRFIAILVIVLWGSAIAANAQCQSLPDDPCISVNQSVIDRSAKAVTELIAARDALAKFAIERATSEAERAAAKVAIERLNAVLAVQDRLHLEYQRVVDLLKQVIDMQSQLIEKLTARLNAGKSGWARFLEVLKTIGSVAAGILIGRGL